MNIEKTALNNNVENPLFSLFKFFAPTLGFAGKVNDKDLSIFEENAEQWFIDQQINASQTKLGQDILNDLQPQITRRKRKVLEKVLGESPEQATQRLIESEKTGGIFHKLLDIVVTRPYKAAINDVDQAFRGMGHVQSNSWEGKKRNAVAKVALNHIFNAGNKKQNYSLRATESSQYISRYIPRLYNIARNNNGFIRDNKGNVSLNSKATKWLKSTSQHLMYAADRIKKLIPGNSSLAEKTNYLNKVLGEDIIQKMGPTKAHQSINRLMATASQYGANPLKFIVNAAEHYRKRGVSGLEVFSSKSAQVFAAGKLSGLSGIDLSNFHKAELAQIDRGALDTPISKVLGAGYAAIATEDGEAVAKQKITNIENTFRKQVSYYPWLKELSTEDQMEYLMKDINKHLNEELTVDNIQESFEDPYSQDFLKNRGSMRSSQDRASQINKDIFNYIQDNDILGESALSNIRQDGRINIGKIKNYIQNSQKGRVNKTRTKRDFSDYLNQYAKKNSFNNADTLRHFLNVHSTNRLQQASNKVLNKRKTLYNTRLANRSLSETSELADLLGGNSLVGSALKLFNTPNNRKKK